MCFLNISFITVFVCWLRFLYLFIYLSGFGRVIREITYQAVANKVILTYREIVSTSAPILWHGFMQDEWIEEVNKLFTWHYSEIGYFTVMLTSI